jgi:predicted RNase H-like nuclease (RuvC/YqgF family)
MAKVGAQRAAELTGRSKSTIQRAMNTGKLSYEVDGNGRRVIDVSELDRAFGLVPQGSERDDAQTVQSEIEKAAQAMEMERLKMRIRMLEDQLDAAKEHLEDVKSQRDQWQKQAQQVLLTSQYSQKQAEEYKEKLEAQQRAVAARRQQLEQQAKARAASQQGVAKTVPIGNENRKTGPIEQQRQEKAETKTGGFLGLWGKNRSTIGEAVKTAAPGKDGKAA